MDKVFESQAKSQVRKKKENSRPAKGPHKPAQKKTTPNKGKASKTAKKKQRKKKKREKRTSQKRNQHRKTKLQKRPLHTLSEDGSRAKPSSGQWISLPDATHKRRKK